MDFMKQQQFPTVVDTDPVSGFRGGMQNDSMSVALDQLMNQGALTQDPGYLSLMNQFQMPQMNTESFDPSKAIMGGALMELSNIILGKGVQNMPMKAYQMGRQMYQQDRALQNQQAQQNFQNRIAVGSLIAQLQKAGLPSSSAGKLAMDFFGKDLKDLTAEEMTQLGAIAKQFSASTNISVDASQKANVKLEEKRAENAAVYENELDSIVAGAPQTQSIIEQLEFLNAGIDTSGNVGNLADGINRALSSLGSSFTVSDDTTWREAYKGLSNKLALNELQFFKGPTTDFEFGVAASINGNLDQTPEGREILLTLAKGRSMMNQAGAQAYLDWARSYEDGIPSAGKFTRTDEYKQLQLKTQYSLNPGSLGKVMAALPSDQRKKLIKQRETEMQKRYEAAFPNKKEAEITQLVDQHMNLELGL